MRNISMELGVIEAMLTEVRSKVRTEWPPVATAAALSCAISELQSLRFDLALCQSRRLEEALGSDARG